MIRILIYCFLIILCIHNSFSENSEELWDDDTIILEAPSARDARQLIQTRDYQWPLLPYTNEPVSANVRPCRTSKGIIGSCTAFRECYPYFKLPDLSIWDSWILGNYDTCSFFNEDGRQAFGVCCTNQLTPSIPSDGSSNTGSDDNSSLGENVQIDSNLNNNGINKNPAFGFINLNEPIHSVWPLQPITHPPNHTAATHPTISGSFPDSVFGSTTPPTYWPPTSGATTTTTQRPIVVYPGWPPQFITHPTPAPPSIVTKPTEAPPTETPVGDTCGAKNGFQDQERIVGGLNAEPNEWPWIVALFNSGRQFCGGTLISGLHVLSAAHCVAHFTSWDVARLTVQLGDHNIRIPHEVRHIEKRVKRVVRHRGFDARTLYNDVAILTMDSPVKFTKTVHPICLPTSGTSRQYNGQTGTVIGWGSLNENGPQPAILQKVSILIWTNRECKQKYGAAAPGGITDSMLCAGTAAKDSCSGDSGGPLMVNDGRWTQIGVVSWGIGCGKGQYPGVYTRVTSFLPWITKNSKNE